MIVNMVGSILTGQIRGELAKIVSECIGKINQTNIQESLSAQGAISGDFKSPLKYRRFHGRIDAMDYQC